MIAIKTFHQRQNIANCLHFSPPLTFDIQGIFITFALKCSVFGSDHLSPVQVQISSTCILVSCLPLSDIPGVFITYLRKCSVFGSDHLSSVWISSINILGYISLVFQAYLLIWIIFWASTSSDILYQYPCLYIQYSWCICHFLGKCSVFGSDNLSLVQISCISIPVYTSIFQAYLSLVRAMEWTDYLVLYEDNEGLVSVWTIFLLKDDNIQENINNHHETQVRLQELLKYPSQTKTKNVKVTIRQLLPGPGNDYRYSSSQLSRLLLLGSVCST